MWCFPRHMRQKDAVFSGLEGRRHWKLELVFMSLYCMRQTNTSKCLKELNFKPNFATWGQQKNYLFTHPAVAVHIQMIVSGHLAKIYSIFVAFCSVFGPYQVYVYNTMASPCQQWLTFVKLSCRFILHPDMLLKNNSLLNIFLYLTTWNNGLPSGSTLHESMSLHSHACMVRETLVKPGKEKYIFEMK